MKKAKGLLRTTSLVSINTFLSRTIGFAREIVFAHFFGATGGFDSFVVAFRIPNLLRGFFAEGAFSQAFVPVLSQYRHKQSPEVTKKFINNILGSLGSVLIFVTILGVLLAPLIITVFAPGFAHHGERFDLSVSMLRITFPYVLFISLTALCGAILNTYDLFGIPSFTPVLLNIVLILSAVVAAPFFHIPVYALAWGVFFAGIIQLIFQLPFLQKQNLLPRPKINFVDKGVLRVLKLMVPAIFGVSVTQINILINNAFASFLKVGSLSWLYYSDRLMNFPLGVFAVAIATVILPKLAKHHATNNHDEYSKTLDWSLRLLLLIGIPSTIGLFILSGPLLSTLLQSGQFGIYDVLMAQQSLMAYAVGVQAFMLVKVLASSFYAKQDIKTPVKIAIIAMFSNIILNFIFIKPLAHAGLALATSTAAFINCGLLILLLKKNKLYKTNITWSKFSLQLIFANILVIIFLFFFTPKIEDWLVAARFWRIYHLSFLLIISMLLYCAGLFISGVRLKNLRISP